jgi:pyruvate/2-oxoglutarate/acetoin dehydrogenase E1 component
MNPEHKHKKAYDQQKLDIERERLAIEQGKAKADQIGNEVKIIIEGDAEEWSQ